MQTQKIKRSQKTMRKYFLILLAVIFLLTTAPAFADFRRGPGGWGRGHEWHDHGYVVRRLPPGHTTIVVSGRDYLYGRGIFYRYSPAGYIVVDPPVGAVVPVLPPDCTTLVVKQTP